MELVASQGNTLMRFIPARLRQDDSSAQSDFRAAHNASITWYLNRRLAEASQTQKEMQEERIKRQLERTKTLGSGAVREATALGVGEASREQRSGNTASSWLGEASSNLIAATIGAPSTPDRRNSQAPPLRESPHDSDESDEEIELTASQIMQFETENATILQGLQDRLASIQQAESSLLEISALQTELTTHLTRQTELTEQLYEDAIATSATVERGNEQLKEAKRRAKDGRLFILVFLIGASLSLLFLHYY
ncbi:hypothetical protein AX16_010284 [Volvariella volvacea WC 439]|nr:hypothetical protein AX16_010284 [Volvariella volvacea WC 439]